MLVRNFFVWGSVRLVFLLSVFGCKDTSDDSFLGANQDTSQIVDSGENNCDYEGIVSSDSLMKTPRSDVEAEAVALCATDELLVSEQDYERVRGNLADIRSTYSEVASIEHMPFYDSKTMAIELVSTEVYEELKSGAYTELDCPNQYYQLVGLEFYSFAEVVLLEFEGRYNIQILAKEYETLSGVQRAWSQEGEQTSTSFIFGASDKSGVWRYLFYKGEGGCENGCLKNYYYYFESQEGQAPTLKGTWSDQTKEKKPSWVDEYSRCQTEG